MIWDRFVRLHHWLLACLFLANYWWLEAGESAHEWAGYIIVGLVSCRVVWGFIGPYRARFSSFLPTPNRLRHNLRHFAEIARQHEGHSPIAGVMILFLLSGVLITAVSGWMQELDRFWGEDWVQNLHEWSADALMLAAAIHIIAVITLQYRYKTPLIRAMIKGK